LRGDYLAIVTLGFGMIFKVVMENGRITLVDSADNLLANDDVRKAYLGI
jgi:ABC-type branched-subunit amino acid transport system permease subunit